MKYQLQETDVFKEKFEQLPKDIQIRFIKQLCKVQENPFSHGKPLGYVWFRELKNKKYRLYYLVGEKTVTVLLISISTKKEQRDSINHIKDHLEEYKDYIK